MTGNGFSYPPVHTPNFVTYSYFQIIPLRLFSFSFLSFPLADSTVEYTRGSRAPNVQRNFVFCRFQDKLAYSSRCRNAKKHSTSRLLNIINTDIDSLTRCAILLGRVALVAQRPIVIKLSRGRSVGLCVGPCVRTCVGLSSALRKNGKSDPDVVWHYRSDGSRD